MNQYICCAKCKNELRTVDAETIRCCNCGSRYKYTAGVYDLRVGRYTNEKEKVVIESFGERWTENWENMAHTQHHYLKTMKPLSGADFRGKIIVDAGCGFGPLSKMLLDNGAGHVICVDYSQSIYQAQQFLENYKDRVTFIRGDIQSPPVSPLADMFISHGVLIHVSDPKKAFLELSKLVQPQRGTGFVWVYAKENNRVLEALLKTIRFFSLRISYRLNWRISSMLEFFLMIMVRGIYFPLDMFFGLKDKLWQGEYLLDTLYNEDAGGTREYRINMIHDALCTPIARHFSKQELLSMVDDAGYRSFNAFFYRNQSWSLASSYETKSEWNQGG